MFKITATALDCILWLSVQFGQCSKHVLHSTGNVCDVTSRQDGILYREKSWLWGKDIYSGQFVDDALLLQDLKLQKGYFLFIVRLIQVIQRLQLLQWRMRADLLPLQHAHREKWSQHQPVVQKTETHATRARLHADHLEVLLHQALDFLLHLLYSLSQLIIPFIQQFVLVQQGFALLLWLSNTLQLVKRRHTLSLTSNQNIKTSTYRENSFFHTSSFLSSTSSELRSPNLRMVELSSAMRLWFLLRSWNTQVFNILDFHLHIHERTEEKPEPISFERNGWR